MKVISNFLLMLVVLGLAPISSNAQIALSSGKSFVFNNGVTEWSEPLTATLQAYKGEQTIPVSIRVKYDKKVMLACHYVIEITNLSENQSVSFSVGTGYTDYNGKDIVEKFSLKPKSVSEGKLMYAYGTKKPSGADDCISNWSPRIEFFETKIK